MGLIDKSAVVAKLNELILNYRFYSSTEAKYRFEAYTELLEWVDTLEVKEVNIAEMADEYYDALMKEASGWMDEGTMAHCRLAYCIGCRDVLNKIQKGE